jgi:hypothetical protein
MVNLAKRFSWICAVALVCLSVHASDTAPYKIGDKAREDITAPIPFDVINAQETASLKTSKAHTIAAIYREVDSTTNEIAQEFLTAFANARSSFSNAVTATYHQPTIDNNMIESSDFGYFLTAYNVENKKFPVTTDLAITWAHGDSGAESRDKWLGELLQVMKQPVQPDQLPLHFLYQKKIRIMPLTNFAENLTYTRAWHQGHVISSDNLPTISSVREKFRKQFREDEQPLAGVLSELLLPNCLPDPALTQLARDASVRQTVAADHFDAGQMIVRRGVTIDAQVKAALDAMDKAMVPGMLNQQIAAEQQRTQEEHDRAQQAQAQAQTEHDTAQLALQQQQQEQSQREQAETLALQEREQAATMREQALAAQIQTQKIRERNELLFGALTAVSILALLILWRLVRQPKTAAISVPAKLQRMDKPAPMVPAELAPLLAQTLKEAVVQGLAAQRAELLEVQRLAAGEITELVHRLDQLQAPMQERLRAYQERIQELQKDLAERTEENRELLRLKIEMMRRQIETERGRVKLN